MRVFIDSEKVEAEDDKLSAIVYEMPSRDSPVVIERKASKSVELENTYEIETSKGTLTIEAQNNAYHRYFLQNIGALKGLGIQWTDKNTVNFGTFGTEFKATRKQFDYQKYSVFFGLSGFEKAQGILAFAKKGHLARNGLEMSVFAKVTTGRHVLEKLGPKDFIRDIRKVEVKSTHYEYSVHYEDCQIREDDNIITKMIVEIGDDCPFASEHFMFMVKDGYFQIDEKTGAYCRSDILRGVKLPSEETKSRCRGSISVRNKGKGTGSVFIYLLDAIEDASHTVVGNVTNGIELPMNLGIGSKFRVETLSSRINTLGMTQSQAMMLAEEHGIKHQRTGNTDDCAIVVEQDPELSIEAKRSGMITTEGVDPNLVFKVRLYEGEAPESVKYFKTITGLTTRQLGRLDVLLSHKDIDMILFKGDSVLAGELMPENPPENGSRGGMIGITNMASRQRGIVGVRFNESREYGPTGEDAHHTNCVGEILNYEGLRNVDEGSTVYFVTE